MEFCHQFPPPFWGPLECAFILDLSVHKQALARRGGWAVYFLASSCVYQEFLAKIPFFYYSHFAVCGVIPLVG